MTDERRSALARTLRILLDGGPSVLDGHVIVPDWPNVDPELVELEREHRILAGVGFKPIIGIGRR